MNYSTSGLVRLLSVNLLAAVALKAQGTAVKEYIRVGGRIIAIENAQPGSLSGAMDSPTGPVQLTSEGSLDWAHWGLNAYTDFDHKSGVTQQISDYAVAASGTPARYANNSVGFTWTDGTPTASAANSATGIYISGATGFRLTVPADTALRTLKVYVGAWRTQGQMAAHLSDGSAADYVDTSLSNSAGVTTLGVYTLGYRGVFHDAVHGV